MIGQDHEAGAEDDDIELGFRFLFFEVIEVHMFDFDVGMVFEQFLARGDIVLVVIDP